MPDYTEELTKAIPGRRIPVDKLTVYDIVTKTEDGTTMSFIDKDGVMTDPGTPETVLTFGRWLWDREVKKISISGNAMLVEI